MTIRHYDTEDEFDAEFDRLEELNMEHSDLKTAVESAQQELGRAEECLRVFEEENRAYLI